MVSGTRQLAPQCVINLMGCLHDPANVHQTFSKCIQNTRANAERLLEVCWTFSGSCKHPISKHFICSAELLINKFVCQENN